MKKITSKVFFALFFISLFFVVNVQAQEEETESPLTFGADVVNRYIWRGLNLGGNTPSIQPSIEYAIGNTGLSIGAWGAYSIGGQTTQETDLILSYTLPNEMFTVAFCDYYLPDDMEENSYFDYSNDDETPTGHLYEATLSFNGTEKIPLSVMFSMNLGGADAQDADGNVVMSKYIELKYSSSIGGTDFDIFAGAALDKGTEYTVLGTTYIEPGYYKQEKAGFVNVGMNVSREIPITDKYSLPVFGSFLINPTSETTYFVFGISF